MIPRSLQRTEILIKRIGCWHRYSYSSVIRGGVTLIAGLNQDVISIHEHFIVLPVNGFFYVFNLR